MNPKEIVAKNLQYYLDKKGITQTQMAHQLGYPEMTVSNWIKAKTYPRVDKLQEMADFFNIKRSDITDDKESKPNYTTSEYNYFESEISAGIPIVADSVAEYEVEKITIPDNLMGKHAGDSSIYITKCSGESMNKVIPDQSLIAVRPVSLEQLKDGDIVVYNYDNEYAVKRYYNHGNKIVFRPDSDDMSFTDNVIDLDNDIELKIKGKVVLYIVELD